jgi:CheY-like chemotaxis protein
MDDQPINEHGTRRLEADMINRALPENMEDTHSYPAPWVVELRIVGTPSVIQATVLGEVNVGRADTRHPITPEINFEPFNGYESGVSRRHAVIFSRNNRLMIRDLASANGTQLNDISLIPHHEYPLRHGDTVTFGKLSVQVFYAVMPSSNNIGTKTQPIHFQIPRLGAGETVLVVDDDKAVAFILGSVLDQAGFKVTAVRSFAEAISFVDNQLPSLILSELMLPDGSGLHLVHYVRELPGGADVPLIIVTGVTGGYQKSQAEAAGINAFLNKPVGIDELLRGVGKVIEQIPR